MRKRAQAADAKLVCYPLHHQIYVSESAGSRVERWEKLRELDLGGHAYVHNTYSERRHRLDDLARRGRSPAKVDDAITNSEGDGHRGAGLEDFRR